MNSSIEKVGKQKCPMWVRAWVYMWECVPVWRMSSGGNSGPAYQAIFCSLLWHLIPICKSALGWRCGWKKAPHPHSSTSAPCVCTTPSSTARRGKQRRLTKRCGQVTTLLWVVLQLCVLCILGQKWSVKAPHSNPVLSWFYDRLRKKTPSRPPCKVGPEPSILMAYNHIRVFYFPAPGPTGTTMTTKASRISFLARRGICTHCSNVPLQNIITALRAKRFFKRRL